MIQLQKKDAEARNIVNKLHREKESAKMFILHKGVLCRLWTEERETFRCTFIPEVLRDPLLVLAHNQNGHNGGQRTYMALKRLYYWPGMRGQVFKHCKNCGVKNACYRTRRIHQVTSNISKCQRYQCN